MVVLRALVLIQVGSLRSPRQAHVPNLMQLLKVQTDGKGRGASVLNRLVERPLLLSLAIFCLTHLSKITVSRSGNEFWVRIRFIF